MLHTSAILTAGQARAADRDAIASGISGHTLMENAGKAVADIMHQLYRPCPVLIVCGTGNNGGDGFVVARLLSELGWKVEVSLVGKQESITGDAKIAMEKWTTRQDIVSVFTENQLVNKEIVVDAVFGTGLDRPVDGSAKEAILAINNSRLPVISLDIASGIDATTGRVMGIAIRALHTITFFRPKLGHALLPGKLHTGRLDIANIGIDGANIIPEYYLNEPPLWQHHFPRLAVDTHKYRRGHALILGGDTTSTGAARLAATSALRSGAGLVSIACSTQALPIYAASLTSVMTKPVNTASELETTLQDKRITSALIGPGCGIGEVTHERVLQILSHKKPCVLDADALTVFKNDSKSLFAALYPSVVMTPHEGEFERLFHIEGLKSDRTLNAAKQSGAVIVFKGPDTVIAAPDGRIAINIDAPAWLATAGSGDVLSGIITGLLAQGMPAWEAACAGVWLHSQAANRFGPGMIAEDIPHRIPDALRLLYQP